MRGCDAGVGDLPRYNEVRQSMTTHDITIGKIRQLPDSLVQEVNWFVDYLLLRQDAT